MRKNELDYDAMSVAELLGESNNYAVPPYQRGYAWGDEQIEQLLEDILESFQRTPDESYILGQTILCKNQSGEGLEIVDGQQRITTIFLLVTLAWRRLQTANQALPFAQAQAIRFNTISGLLFRVDASEKIIPRVEVSKDGRDYVERILNGVDLGGEGADESQTQENIRGAKGQIEAFFDKELLETESLFGFTWHILHNVLFFSLTLSSPKQALGVFAKMNNRGLTLDDADLLKNLLFQKATDDEYSKLSNQWDKASQELFKARLKRIKSMQFLLKALVGIETGESIPTSKIFDRWEELLTSTEGLDSESEAEKSRRIHEKTLEFANSLSARAKHLQLLSNGKTPVGSNSPINFGTYFFKWVQHLEVLLAGDHLEADAFRHLSRIVEDRVVLSIFAGEKNQKFEAMVHKWSRNISKLHSLASREEIIAASVDALVSVDELLEDARTETSRLSYRVQTQRHKLRYLLARISRDLEIEAGEATEQKELREFMQSPNRRLGQSGFHLDHVFPQSESKRPLWPGAPENYELVHSLGNLVLLHGGDNSEQSDALPDEDVKVNNFAGSLVINRMLCSDTELGAMPQRVKQTIDSGRQSCTANLSSWGEDAIKARFDFFWEIFSSSVRKSLTA